MKKSILFITMLWLFIACEKQNVINENRTTPTPIEKDRETEIDSSECYMLQSFNELGKSIDQYDCIVFQKNAGRTFEEAFNNMKPELDALVNRDVDEEKKGANYDATKWELRKIERLVKNSPNEKLIYTSIELYMHSLVYNAYTIVRQYIVIDSEGNVYQIVGPVD
ncbi:MAG: hypothetical protein IKN91_08440 [Paludibacteraceae bacterium]|nr:hypothetical protein [Paludibacteraceae bacterium]